MDKPPSIPAEWDPCPRRTRGNLPCGLPRYHRGLCRLAPESIEQYRVYAEHLRHRARTMTITELEHAAEFHLLAWRVLQGERHRR